MRDWGMRRPEGFWRRLMLAGAAVFTLVFSLLAVMRYAALNPVMWDLGNFDQPLWNVLQGHGLEVTQDRFDGNEDRMTSHFEPILYPLALLYTVAPSPVVLLLVQVLFLAATSLVLFRILSRLLPPPAAALLGLAFLLHPSLQFSAVADFHTDSPAMFFLSLAFMAMLEERWRLYAFALLGALLCKEYAALVAACLGAYVLVVRKRAVAGALTLAVAGAWFYVAMEVVMPHFNHGNPSATLVLNYRELGAEEGLLGMAGHMWTQPAGVFGRVFSPVNLENLVYLFAPLLFLPWLGLPELAIASPIFAKDLLAGFDIGNHHLAMALPFLFIAVAKALSTRRGPFGRRLLPALLGSLAFGSFLLAPGPSGQVFWRSLTNYVPSPYDSQAKALLARIPEGVPVSASPHLTPRLTHRRFCFLFPRPMDRSLVDYVVVDFSPELPDANWCGIPEARDSLEALKRDPRFELVENRGEAWLFRRKAISGP